MTEPVQVSSRPRELISFRIGEQEFCVDIMAVREIRGWTPATQLPHAPAYVRGVINLRGAVLPIIDLAARLGLPAPTPTARHVIIVVMIGQRICGLLVDAVSDIVSISEEQVQQTPDLQGDRVKSFLRGIITIDNRMISEIALESIGVEQEQAAA